MLNINHIQNKNRKLFRNDLIHYIYLCKNNPFNTKNNEKDLFVNRAICMCVVWILAK